LADKVFQYDCEVFYEDTDMGGRVYYANYLKFIERARSKLIESLQIDQRALLLAENKFFVVKNIIADYLLPAYFGDKLVIGTTLIELKRASMMLKQEILKDNKKIFDCDVKLALLNSSGKPEKFSVDFINKIEKFFKFSQKKMGE
jgi:acyl-CoA thioester hydrolase